MFKKSFATILTLSMLFSFTAAASSEESAEVSKTGEPVKEFEVQDDGKIHLSFAYVVDCVDTSQQIQWNASKDYVDYLNNTRDDLYIEMSLFDGNSSVETQLGDIETAIAMGVDAIILSAVDPSSVAPIIKEAQDAGIYVIDWRGTVGDINYVGANETKWGELNYEWTKEYLDSNPDVVLYAGLQYGATSHPAQFARLTPLETLAEEYPDRFVIVVSQYSDWTTATSMQMAEDWMQAYPQMNYISSASGTMMAGVIEALRGEGVMDDFVLTAFNGMEEDFEMLEAKELSMDIGAYIPAKMGILIEDTILMLLEGMTGTHDVGAEISFIATQDNYENCREMATVCDYYNYHYFDTQLAESYVD